MSNIITPLFKKYKTIILILLLLIVEAYFTLTLPQYTADIVNIGIKNRNLAFIFKSGGMMLTITVLATITSITVSFISSRFSSGYARDLRKMLFRKVFTFSNHEMNDISKSSLITITNKDITHIQIFIEEFLTVIVFAPIIGIVAIFKAYEIGTNLYIVILLAIITLFILLIPIIKRFIHPLTRLHIVFDKLNSNSIEVLTGIPVIKTFVRQKYEENKFQKINNELDDIILNINKYILLLAPLLTFMLSFMTIGIIFFGSGEVTNGHMLPGDLIAFIQYAIQIITAFMMFTLFFSSEREVFLSIKRANKILNTEIKIVDGEIETIDDDKLTLEFKNVSYKYPKSEKNTLTNINFKLEPGKTLAILGGIGSGKSTIINFIPRLLDPTSGEILLNGEDIRNFKLKTYRQRISLTPQKSHLFTGTIKSNINISSEKKDDDEIYQALEMANADFVDSLDETVLQDGSNYSSGQKQCISLARSLLNEYDFYLFDDCFTALDMNTKQKIKNNLGKIKDKSILIVSQEISTIKDADEILILDKGRIIDRGSHKSLMKTCDLYRDTYDSQSSVYGEMQNE